MDLLLVPTALHHYTVEEIQEEEDRGDEVQSPGPAPDVSFDLHPALNPTPTLVLTVNAIFTLRPKFSRAAAVGICAYRLRTF